MKIILKHIFRNIKENLLRSFLIILTISAAVATFIINISLSDKMEEVYEYSVNQNVGNADFRVRANDYFFNKSLKLMDTECDYLEFTEVLINLELDDKVHISSFWGIDTNNAYKMEMLDKVDTELGMNNVVIDRRTAKNYGIEAGDVISFKYNDKNYNLKVEEVIDNEGLLTYESDFPIFIISYDLIKEILGFEADKIMSLFIDVKDDAVREEYLEYFNSSNDLSNKVIEQLRNYDSYEQTGMMSGLILIAMLMMTVMVVFILSSMNRVIIAERMPVVGTFRSVGASRAGMNLILIIEIVLYGVCGGVVGALAGGILNTYVAKFLSNSNMNLDGMKYNFEPVYLLAGVGFAVIMQLIVCAGNIIKANRKSIKGIIFDKPESRYRINIIKSILGIIMFIASIVIMYMNVYSQFSLTIASIIMLCVGSAFVVPIIMKCARLILENVAKLTGARVGRVAVKNIGYSKHLIASATLISMILVLFITIITAGTSFTKVLDSYKEIYKFDVVAEGMHNEDVNYKKLEELAEVSRVEFMYCVSDNMTLCNRQPMTIQPNIVGVTFEEEGIEEIDYKLEDLSGNDILIDELFAEKNNIKKGDTIVLEMPSLWMFGEFNVVGYVDSTKFYSSRNAIIMNLNTYKENFGSVPARVEIFAEDNVNVEALKEVIDDKIKELNIDVKTYNEYIQAKEDGIMPIIKTFYVMLCMMIILALIGVVNNQIMGIMSRKRELACLCATYMSKAKIMQLLLYENAIMLLIAESYAVVTGYFLVKMFGQTLEGIAWTLNMVYDYKIILMIVIVMFGVVMLSTFISLWKIRKLDVIREIKYE